MEYKGYKIESIKNDGHLQRNAFGIYKNGKLISTATTSKEAQHEIDDIERELKDMKTSDRLDRAIHTLDASVGHEVIVYADQALREMGKNNSVGKYDRVVRGVRSLLGESLLPPDELKKVVKREVERLLKKYNLD